MKRFYSVLSAGLLLVFCSSCGNPDISVSDSQGAAAEQPAAEHTETEMQLSGSEETGVDDIPEIIDIPEEVPEPEYTVRAAEWTDVQWTQFQCAYFTLNIPVGWDVQWNGNSEALSWQANAGDGSMLGLSNVDHLIAAKNEQMANLLTHSFYLEEGSVQELFGKFYADTTDYFTVQNSCVPANKDMLQSLRNDKKIWDYQSLYATFAENGVDGEGIYSAVIMEAPDLILTGGYNYAMWEINGVFTEFAPLGELVNWQPVLSQIAQSFTYTDYYWEEMMSRLGQRTEPISTSSDTDPVMEAFEQRMTEDTIIQEKRSDMIGEYERVYDNETGNIYRAYNGFLDDIGSDQTKYSPITDSQYADGYVGWIDK